MMRSVGCIFSAVALLNGCASELKVSSTDSPTGSPVPEVAVSIAPEQPPALNPQSPSSDTTEELEASTPVDIGTTDQAAGDMLFSCWTDDDEIIAVYDLGTFIQYVFGPEGQPELVLDVLREEVSTYQWQGIGRYESYSVSIPNGDTVYIVSWARDRIEINQPAEAGVSVEIDGEYVTTVDCATDIIHNLIGVDLPPTPL